MTMNCEVCTERFTKELRKCIECPFCEFSACSTCHQKYLLSSSQYAHCMSCRKVWNREVLVNNFTDKFVNKTYKTWREEVLFEREKSFMPETQPYVEIELEIRQTTNEIHRILEKVHSIHAAAFPLMHSRDENRLELYRKACDMRKEAAVLNCDGEFLNYKLGFLRNKSPTTEKKQFVRACPADECMGFLSTAWKCGLCQVNVCSKCHEIKHEGGDEHVCDAANVQTAELLAKDTKTCPTCACLIYKISGCDQIWCTQCHTAFNWRTMQIERGVIHNPHYYEYMRRNGSLPRAVGDIPCGGLPDYYALNTNVHKRTHTKEQLAYIIENHRIINHLQFGGVIARYQPTPQLVFRNLRIKYMMKELDKIDYQRRLQQLEKQDNKYSEIRDVLDLYRTVGTEILQKIAAHPEGIYIDELIGIRKHCHELIADIRRRWKCSLNDTDFLL